MKNFLVSLSFDFRVNVKVVVGALLSLVNQSLRQSLRLELRFKKSFLPSLNFHPFLDFELMVKVR